jgi:hypothetical protein
MWLLLSQHHRFPREGKIFKGSSTTSTHGLQATPHGVAFFWRFGALRRGSVAVGHRLAGFEAVNRAAVRATGFTGFGHVQGHLGVCVPSGHARLRAGAHHATVSVEVLGAKFDDSRSAHGVQTWVSQWAYLGLRPLTISKNAVWIFSVIGPRLPT